MLVTKEIKTTRLNLCNTCEHLQVNKLANTCGKCDCIIHLKVQVKSQTCPIGKW